MKKHIAHCFFSQRCDLDAIDSVALEAFCNNRLGELFVEYKEDEVIKIEGGIVQTPSFHQRMGFGLRTFEEECVRYSYSSNLDVKSVKDAVRIVSSGTTSHANNIHATSDLQSENSVSLYTSERFISSVTLKDKIDFLKRVDAYARSASNDVAQVIAALASSWQVVSILTDSGQKIYDVRPLVRFTVSIVISKNGEMESGMFSGGGRFGYEHLLSQDYATAAVDEALRQAYIKIIAVKAPVGELAAVIGNGWTGILLHEAIGHGLEGDSIRRKTSSFCNLLGQEIASKNVTVIDNGNIENRRGSIDFDDEGTKTQSTALIENGKLVSFINDRMSARIMKCRATGNGRRESYEHEPITRMTNTYMLAGDKTVDEMIASVKYGIFAKTFSDGQVDIASGKFVFSASEAYLIEGGKITAPVKGAMLIGDGPSILKKISMVGNDFAMDPGTGTCGKCGQMVPVGVGEPSVLIDKITVGGSNL